MSICTSHGRSPLATLCLSLALLLGLCFPTSIHGDISKGLGYCSSLALLGIYLTLGISLNSVSQPSLFVCAVTINATLLLATLLSPLSRFAPGAYTFYFLLSCLYLLDLRSLRFNRFLSRLFSIVSVVFLTLAFASAFPVEQVNEFFISNYSAFYPELVPAMLRLHKPVLMFASHSLAGFFYCLFFLLNFLTYTHRKTVFHLVLALGFLIGSLALRSVTAYVYLIVGCLHILIHFGVHRNLVLRVCSIAVGLGVACTFLFSSDTRDLVWAAISPLFTSNMNGLAARYTAAGTLAPNINYILANPFTPVGVRYAEDLWFVDSGPVEHMLRGSACLVLAVYVGFFLFLKRNLRSLSHCLLLFGVYAAFEIGFSSLTYPRTLFLTPFAVSLLNGISGKPEREGRDVEVLMSDVG